MPVPSRPAPPPHPLWWGRGLFLFPSISLSCQATILGPLGLSARALLCTYLVEDILLRAQVEVRQDAGQAHTGHGQAGLGEAHGWQRTGLALAEAGEAGGESGEAPCGRRQGSASGRLASWANEARAQHLLPAPPHPVDQPSRLAKHLLPAGRPLIPHGARADAHCSRCLCPYSSPC